MIGARDQKCSKAKSPDSHNTSDATLTSAGSILLACRVVSTAKACNLTLFCRTHSATLLAEGQPTLPQRERARWARKLLYNLTFTELIVSRWHLLTGLGNFIQICSNVKDNWGQTEEIMYWTDIDSTTLIHYSLCLLTIIIIKIDVSKFTLIRKEWRGFGESLEMQLSMLQLFLVSACMCVCGWACSDSLISIYSGLRPT